MMSAESFWLSYSLASLLWQSSSAWFWPPTDPSGSC